MHVEGVLANNDYILNGCYIEITSNCNLRCIHCYNESGELRDQISVEAFKNVLGCYDNPKKASITLSGGEPLLHPQVWKFIDMMLESGILARNILLITNATCITDDVANMLAEKHVSVQVSLNGSRAELHDSICGKGNFERTMAGLQRLLSKHANMVIVRNMMNKQNMNDNWDMFCEKLIDMGVHKIMLAGLKKVGRANENLEKIALTPLEYQSLIDRLKESKVITGINDEYRKLAGDEAESNIRIDIPVPYSGVCPYVYQDENPVPISPRIATNGDVYLCQSFMDQRYCIYFNMCRALEKVKRPGTFLLGGTYHAKTTSSRLAVRPHGGRQARCPGRTVELSIQRSGTPRVHGRERRGRAPLRRRP